MKKFFMFAAAAAVAMSFASCNKNDDPNKDKPAQAEVKTCAENLVLHFGFEEKEVPGKGVSLVENKGNATIGEGFIGKGWVNSKGNNTEEAYSKYSLNAADLKSINDITLTAWVKNSAEFYKGAILSINGSGTDWPAFIAYFDNKNTGEDNVVSQQVNGRMIFHDEDNTEQNLWLDTFSPAFAVYGKWFQFAFTYEAAAGMGNLYVDGVKVGERPFDKKIVFNNLLTDKANAIYVGAWASRVEGANKDDWQAYFAGSLDEIRLFNKALTEAEIQALRKEELAISLAK